MEIHLSACTSRMSDGKEKAAAEAAEKHAMTEFKRSGTFDKIRKDTLRSWESSDEGVAFLAKLKGIVTSEIERDPSLLARDRGKAATLIGGSVERSQLYPDARTAAAKKIFQSEDFKMRVYESLKQYFPKTDEAQNGNKIDNEKQNDIGGDTKGQKALSAKEAALEFIKREQGA